MKIFNPNSTDHTFKLVPRDYLIPDEMLFKSEFTGIESDIVINGYSLGNYVYIDFTNEFEEEDKGEIVIKSNSTIIYRGAYHATSQDTQTYDLSQDTYTYYDGE